MNLCALQIFRSVHISSSLFRFFCLSVCCASYICSLPLACFLIDYPMFFSNRLLSFCCFFKNYKAKGFAFCLYLNFVLKFSSMNFIISSLEITCLLGILPLAIFLIPTLLPALLKTTVTSNPRIPMSL